jgi:hypothetical protein
MWLRGRISLLPAISRPRSLASHPHGLSRSRKPTGARESLLAKIARRAGRRVRESELPHTAGGERRGTGLQRPRPDPNFVLASSWGVVNLVSTTILKHELDHIVGGESSIF